MVTGAAGGITSAIVADLAGGERRHVLPARPGGRALAAPTRRSPSSAQDRERLKLALIEEAKAKGEKPTPVDDRPPDHGDRALRRGPARVESVEAAGGTALWRSANLLDGPAIAGIVEEIRKAHGRIDVLVHAGGIEISRKLSEKEAREFDLVFDIKADGFFSLLKAAEGMPIGATVVFSSVAGRFGNAGQTDYSAANDLLCAMSSALRRARPETRTIAIDWTAWGGIGMATRGSIPQIMAAAGISMLPPESGIPTVRRELVAGGGSGELVVAGTLGIMGAEYDPTGGLDVEKAQARARRPRAAAADGGPREGRAALRRPRRRDDARPAGAAVPLRPPDRRRPRAARRHGHRGVRRGGERPRARASTSAAIEDESFLLPFKFFRNQPATLHLSRRRVAGRGGGGRGERRAALDRPAEAGAPGAGARPLQGARCGCAARPRRSRRSRSRSPRRRRSASAASRSTSVYFHGPAYQVIERAAVEGDGVVALMAAGPAPEREARRGRGARGAAAPRAVLPGGGPLAAGEEADDGPADGARAGGRSTGPEDAAGEKRLYVTVEARGGGEAFDARVVDEKGLVHAEVVGYRTVALPGQRTLAS